MVDPDAPYGSFWQIASERQTKMKANLGKPEERPMIRNLKHFHEVLEQVWAAGYSAQARVGLYDRSEPVITVRLPKKTGVDFAAVNEALHNCRVIFRICSADRPASIEFALNHMYAIGYRRPPQLQEKNKETGRTQATPPLRRKTKGARNT
jgi:hypothetical protein